MERKPSLHTPRNKGGRGKAFWRNPELIGRLKAAFGNDFTIMEACRYAQISEASYYEWKRANPEEAGLIEDERLTARMAAKMNIVKRIHAGDLRASWRFLEHRDPEYKPVSKYEVVSRVAVRQELSEEKKALLDKALGHVRAGKKN